MFAYGELDINAFCVSICCYATRYLLALRAIDIFLATLEIRYVAYGNECRLRRCCYLSRVARWATHIERVAPYRVADISSDASAAHIDVESSCETHDGLDVSRTREHIDGGDFTHYIARFDKLFRIAGEGSWIAGDVDELFKIAFRDLIGQLG